MSAHVTAPRTREMDAKTSALVTGLQGGAEQRKAACTALLDLEAEHFASGGVGDDETFADIAVACSRPLCEVLCKTVAEVPAEEYIRVARVLTALCGVSPGNVGGECTTQCWDYLMSHDSALGVALSKEPETLTPEDALVVAAAYGAQCVHWASPSGVSAVLRVNGMSYTEWITGHVRSAFLLAPPPDSAGPHQQGLPWLPGDRRNMALVRLFLDMLREPAKIPEFVLVGVFFSISHASMIGHSGRPVVALMALEDGAIELLMDSLRNATASGLLAARGFARGGHEALQSLKEIVGSAQMAGTDVTQQLLDCGFIDLLITALKETEMFGAGKTNALLVCWTALWTLLMLDGSALCEIEAKLRTLASTLRFLADSEIDFIAESGLTSGVFGTLIAANLFGKDEEENSFGLTQRDITHIIPWMSEVVNPATWGWAVPFHSRTCQPLLNLCKSDTAKQMLLSEDNFIPLLIEGLLLDPQHPSRKDADETTKSIIQRDIAECIQQVSLFGPGCEALKANPNVVIALDTTFNKARSEEAKVCAAAALKQLCPERSEKTLVIDRDSKHLMMSYQWENQEIVKRIVADLQSRRYKVCTAPHLVCIILASLLLLSLTGKLLANDFAGGPGLVRLGVYERQHRRRVRCQFVDCPAVLWNYRLKIGCVAHDGGALAECRRRSRGEICIASLHTDLSRAVDVDLITFVCPSAAGVQRAELIIYGVSEKYKESANCRLELNYGSQEEISMMPLMMQKDYKAKGWLGLLLGQEMWYAFWPEAVSTDEKFKEQMDKVARDVGDRGKIKTKAVHEGVPPNADALTPAFELSPEPAPAPARSIATRSERDIQSVAEAQAPAPPTTPGRSALASQTHSFTPSMQIQMPSPTTPGAHQQRVAMSGASLLETVAILKEQRDEAKAERAEAQAEREKMQARLEQRMEKEREELAEQKQAMQAQIAELTAPKPAAIAEEDVMSLQARLEAVHMSKLITDEELYAIEDLVADYSELEISLAGQAITEQMIYSSPGDTFEVASKLHKLIGISRKMRGDAAFARQLRRKVL